MSWLRRALAFIRCQSWGNSHDWRVIWVAYFEKRGTTIKVSKMRCEKCQCYTELKERQGE